MSSLVPQYRPRFADTVANGDVVATNRRGAERVVVIAEPVRIKNLVGGKSFVILRVRLEGTDVEGQMVFSPSNVVYIRHMGASS